LTLISWVRTLSDSPRIQLGGPSYPYYFYSPTEQLEHSRN